MSDLSGLQARDSHPIVLLHELCDLCSGITKGRKINSTETFEVPYMAVANVQDSKLSLDNVKTIDATPEEIERYRLLPGDLLLTEGGDPDKLGRGAIWNGEIDACIHQNHIFRARKSSNHIDMHYLARLVSSPYGKRYFLHQSKQTTGIASINMTQLKRFPVPLPPLEEQRRIAAILDRAEKVRRLATESLTATSRALYESIFSRDILAADHRLARIGDIATQLPSGYGSDLGHSPLVAPVAKVSNITANGRFHREFESRSFTEFELERLLVREHDLLVVKSSGSKANILSGKTAICGKDEADKLIASNFLMRLCIDQSAADPRFVWHILNSKISKDFVKKVAGTTTYPNLKWSTYVDHPIPLPSLSEQRLIRERLDSIDALSHQKSARLAKETGNLIAVLQHQLIGR